MNSSNEQLPALEVKNLRKVFRDAELELCVIDSLSFRFPASGTVAITGRSGVGKSTLLNLLGGLERPTSGSVWLAGNDTSLLDVEQLAACRAEHVGFIFQFHHLLAEFRAWENVAMPLLIKGVSREESREAAVRLLKRVGLEGRVEHRPGQLSGGEQQRVAIARALVAKPRIVFADEPTGSLDIGTAREVQRLLVEINEESKSLLVVVTHLNELAQEMELVLEMGPGGTLEQRSV